ncbi:MAG: response regulator [Chitinivibrionales bacterium]|nr:response regulator [Chitinivibrionales bacterium]MBD3395359.1 response regulator [Chitinivibrionales bacterium]
MATKSPKKTILIISADTPFLNLIRDNLCLQGFETNVARTYSDAFAAADKTPPDIVFCDIENTPTQEMDFVSYLKSRSPATEIVVLTGIDEIEDATYALRNGASFYLLKPVDCAHLKTVVEKLSSRADRNREHIELEQQLLADLMGTNKAMQKMLKLAIKIAPTMSTVLIEGESGTGKEFFARIIHRMSQRYEGQFVAMNCGAIPDTLFESELFGHRKGAFTGADRDKPGLVEEAHMGTLFLDEVGELSPAAQVKLLRFLQERSFNRVGETNYRRVNTRVIAATNKVLAKQVREGHFRDDLFYRLNIFSLRLPPLRERKETIPNLVRLFVHRNNSLLGKNVGRISRAAEVVLANYDYPGNVRELENIIEHAVVLAEGDEITERELPESMFTGRLLLSAPTGPAGDRSPADIPPLSEVEKQHITAALKLLDYNYSETAKKLGVSRSTLWRKIKSYGIETPAKGSDQ